MIALAQRPPAIIRASLSSRFEMPAEQDDRAYYQRRIARCVELAAQAACHSARLAHQELARLYSEKLGEVDAAKARFAAAKNDAIETAKTTAGSAAGGAAGTSFLVVIALIIGAASAGLGGVAASSREDIVIR